MIFATLASTFLAGCVESIETLSVLLAVGLAKGWKSAWVGLGSGLLLLTLILSTIGVLIVSVVPVHLLNLVMGTLMLLFGMRWLVKATLRYGGKIPFRNESAAFDKTLSSLGPKASSNKKLDKLGIATAFGAVVLEGSEVAFTVVTFGLAPHMRSYATLGAVAGIIAVAIVGILLKAPLAKAPENGIKFIVGVMLSALGTTWLAEGLHLHTSFGFASYPLLLAVFLLTSLILIARLKTTSVKNLSRFQSPNPNRGQS